MKKTVILAAGDFPTHPVPLRALGEADFIVCCDSAYNDFRKSQFNNKDFAVVGDGDSLSDADKKALGGRWIKVGEQDYNDLHKAMQYAVSQCGDSQFTILGATGKREDHTLGNISYLVTFAEEYPGAEIVMLTDRGRFSAMKGCRTFASIPRQQVSIFSMDAGAPIYSSGLRWPLDGLCVRRWWQASLNEALGTEFSLRTEGWIVVFRTYGPKE